MSAFRSDRARKPYERPARQSRAPEGLWVHDKAPVAPAALLNANNKSSASSNTKLIVSNLHYEVSPKDLTAIFGQIGTLVREPLLRYDRSGRSSGNAVIFFETSVEATRAKNQFDGILAKGQPMKITYDTERPSLRIPRAPSSLLNRIQKPPLAERLGRDDASMKTPAPRGGAGPTRMSTRGGGRGGGRPVPRAPKKPKTAEDLDKELDAFMGDGPKEETGGASGEAQAVADVDMV